MANNKNLKPFLKGDPRTIAAAKKSKRRPLEKQWREKLTSLIGKSDKSELDILYSLLWKFLKKGNMKAGEMLLNRSFGKAKDLIVLSSDSKNPIIPEKIQIEFVDNATENTR